MYQLYRRKIRKSNSIGGSEMPEWNRSFMREKKPIDRVDTFGDTVLCCPTCKNPVVNYLNKSIQPPYCMMCGQKLKWEESGDGKS